MNPRRRPFRSSPLLALAVLAAFSCGDSRNLTGPDENASDGHGGYDGPVAERGHIDVCVWPTSPAGTYGFHVTVDGGPPSAFTLQPNQCARVWTRLAPIGAPVDPPETVTVTQVSQPAGATYLGVGNEDGTAPHVIDVPGRTITYQANYWHGGVATYMSAVGQGCVPEQWRTVPGSWLATGISANQSFNAFFGVPFLTPDRSLDQALRLGVVPAEHKLARHAVAAVKNAQHRDVNFPLSVGQVRAIVRAADEGRVPVLGAAQTLSNANHLGCPLTD